MAIPTFEATKLQAICDVLGDTEHGLTGGEIGRALAAVGIEDPLVGATKRHRIFEALAARQQRDRCGVTTDVLEIHFHRDRARPG